MVVMYQLMSELNRIDRIVSIVNYEKHFTNDGQKVGLD